MTKTPLSRREVLRAGAAGGLGLAAPGLVTARVAADRPLGGGAADRSVILLWLCGGPNHLDAMHHCLTGQAGAPDDAPYIGSVLSHVRPSRKNVASYFWLMNPGRASVFISAYIGTGGFLGLRHAPVFVGSQNNHPAMPS